MDSSAWEWDNVEEEEQQQQQGRGGGEGRWGGPYVWQLRLFKSSNTLTVSQL